MTTLVTGGAGFIGSHIVDRLVAQGERVVVLDDLSTGSRDNLHQHGAGDAVSLVEASILDEGAVDTAMAGCERVFHLAAAVGVRNIVEHPLRSIEVNARGTEIVVDACARRGCALLLASSSEVYGKSARVPMREDDDRVLGSTTVHRWSYATAKALDEHLVLAYAARDLRAVIVRYFNIYGPRMDPRGYGSVMATFLNQALRGEPLTVHADGLQTRCFTYVDDCVEATIRAMQSAGAEPAVFNVGNAATETTILDLARVVLQLTGSGSEIVHQSYEERYGARFEDARRRVPAVERAREVLEWTAAVGLEDGLRRTLAAWRA